jgi:hypothetical protein
MSDANGDVLPAGRVGELLRLCEAATPGPWEVVAGCCTHGIRRVGGGWERLIICDLDPRETDDVYETSTVGITNPAVAFYIAACDPATVAALCREVLRLRGTDKGGA